MSRSSRTTLARAAAFGALALTLASAFIVMPATFGTDSAFARDGGNGNGNGGNGNGGNGNGNGGNSDGISAMLLTPANSRANVPPRRHPPRVSLTRRTTHERGGCDVLGRNGHAGTVCYQE